jgi:hypothetical protein
LDSTKLGMDHDEDAKPQNTWPATIHFIISNLTPSTFQ